MTEKSDNHRGIMGENSKQISLSVIVPCFNVEQFLNRSLGCLERQWNGRTDYEIILINDASTDRTLDKLNDFAQRWPQNVIVIDKKTNEGVAAARNSGLEIARGSWIVFFDPDDALVDNGYSTLLNLVEKNKDVEILSFGVSAVNDKDWTEELVKNNSDDVQIEWEGTGQEYVQKGLSGVCWRFLFKRELLENRKFPSLTLLEDYMFVLPVFLTDVKVARTFSKIYLYIQHTSSATNMVDGQKLNRGCDDMVKVLGQMSAVMKGLNEPLQSTLKARQSSYVANLLSRLLLCDKDKHEIRQIRDYLQNELSILPLTGNDLKMRLRSFVYSNLWLFELIRPLYRKLRHVKAKS